MASLIQVVTYPLRNIAQLLFNLVVGTTSVGSLLVVGSIFIVLISAIMHATVHGGGIGNIVHKIKDKKK